METLNSDGKNRQSNGTEGVTRAQLSFTGVTSSRTHTKTY